MGIDIHIHKVSWIEAPRERWNNGLLNAGAMWKAENAKYPSGQSSTYIRKGGLRDKSDFMILLEGSEMELRSTYYWKYLMKGTGVYGPRGVPFGPIKSRFLVWKSEKGGLYGGKRGGSGAEAVGGVA